MKNATIENVNKFRGFDVVQDMGENIEYEAQTVLAWLGY